MELDFWPLLLDCTQGGAVIDQQSRRINGIQCHTVRVGVDEFFQLVRIVTGDPACQVEVAGHDARLHAVLMLQPVGDDFKLQLPDCAE